MATAAAGLAPAKEVVEKKVELLKEVLSTSPYFTPIFLFRVVLLTSFLLLFSEFGWCVREIICRMDLVWSAQIRAHEVAIAELDNLNLSRVSLFPSVSLPCLRFVSGATRWYWYQITNAYH